MKREESNYDEDLTTGDYQDTETNNEEIERERMQLLERRKEVIPRTRSYLKD